MSEFKEAHKDTFLSGSYARHTAINDINDVDVICIVDIDRLITEPDVVLAWTQSILDEVLQGDEAARALGGRAGRQGRVARHRARHADGWG